MSELRAAVIQTDPVFGSVEANLSQALALVPPNCDLAVLPELCTTGYQFKNRVELGNLAEEIPGGPTCGRLREHAARTGATLIAGLAERAGTQLFNAAVLVRPDGSVERFRKIHLFWDEKLVFDPGDLGFPVFEACGTTIGMMICFDWIFPESAGTLARRGARVICHPSNLVLPHCPDAMPLRALENRVFTLTANRVGAELRTGQRLRFIGRSTIASPQAEKLLVLSDDRSEAGMAILDLGLCDPRITPRNHIVEDRRPEFYD